MGKQLITMEVITFLYILTALLVSLYIYLTWKYSYWKRRGLEYMEPHFLYGNFKEYVKKKLSFGNQLVKNYNELKAKGLKHGGCYMFFKPFYLPVDIDIIKNILQKDFSHFDNRGLYVNEKVDPLTGHLFNLEDDKWRNLRVKLTPTFTSGKMKMMFQTLKTCTVGLEDVLKDYYLVRDAVDIKDVVSRFTTDIIGSCAFGIDCNSLKDPNSEFRQFGKKLVEPDFLQRVKAGFETSATTMTFALLELALNQEIQDKLRQEIEFVLKKHNGELTYEAVMEMTYLDKVVQETLRKHPPLPSIPRICNKEYRVPGTDVILESGTGVKIPFLAIQRDPDYYPDPEKFDPERFSEENKVKRPAFTFLSFGEGPRICIGARFGLMQSKVGLVAIIRKFKVSLNEKTKMPITYSPNTFISTVEGGVWLNTSSIE